MLAFLISQTILKMCICIYVGLFRSLFNSNPNLYNINIYPKTNTIIFRSMKNTIFVLCIATFLLLYITPVLSLPFVHVMFNLKFDLKISYVFCHKFDLISYHILHVKNELLECQVDPMY